MSKKFFALIIAMVCIFTFTATAFAANDSDSQTGTTPPVSSGDIIEGESMNIIIGSVLNPGSPENIAMQWILDTLKERTNGKITGTLYEGGSIGSESELLEQARNNDCQITMTSLVGLDKFAPQYNTISVPYLYKSADQIRATWNSSIGESIRAEFEKKGLYYDGIMFRGNRHMTANKIIETPDMLKGLKLRLPETQQWVTVWSGMGALPTPTAASETFSALQTGVVDAQENNITSNYNKAMWQVQKYTMLTNHVVDTYIFCWSKDWFDGMSEDYQVLVKQTILDAADYATQITADNEAKLRAEMEANGMEFIEVDTEAFKEAALPSIQKIAADWADGVYEQAMKDTAN